MPSSWLFEPTVLVSYCRGLHFREAPITGKSHYRIIPHLRPFKSYSAFFGYFGLSSRFTRHPGRVVWFITQGHIFSGAPWAPSSETRDCHNHTNTTLPGCSRVTRTGQNRISRVSGFVLRLMRNKFLRLLWNGSSTQGPSFYMDIAECRTTVLQVTII